MHILLTRHAHDSKDLIQKFKSNGFKVSKTILKAEELFVRDISPSLFILFESPMTLTSTFFCFKQL